MNKLTTLLLAIVLLLSMLSMMTLSSGAIVEGDWVTSRAADDYKDEESYRPACGYKYEVDQGLVLVSADYTNNTPYTHVHTRKAYDLKDNNATADGKSISLEFTVTDFDYEGSDHWVGISLHSQEIFAPGQTGFGEGMSVLIRGAGNGTAVAQFFYLNDDSGYQLFSMQNIVIQMNEQGQEVYTFEVAYTGTEYVFTLCGTEVKDESKVVNDVLNTYCTNGAYVGLSFYTTSSGSKLGATISKFQGETPYGEDSAEPEENRNNFAPIADSSTVPAGQPALIWNSAKEQFNSFQSTNIDLAPNDDGTMKATAKSASGYIIFSPKVAVSYEASDFPVIALLTRDCYAESATIFYSAGEIMGAQPDCSQEIDIAEYDFGEGWCMGILDLTDDLDWQGRVNMIRTDIENVDHMDEEMKYYDIAYFAAFRTIEDAEQYAKDYLIALLGHLPETEAPTTKEPATQEPATQEPAQTDANTEDPAQSEQTTDPTASVGCKSILAIPAAALFVMMGAAFAIKKKD